MGGGDLTKRVERVEGHISQLNESIKTINGTLGGIQTQITRLFALCKSNDDKEMETSLSAMDKTVEDINSKMSNYEKSYNIIQNECNNIQMQLNLLKSQQEKLNEKLIKQESHSRRDNLLFDGIPEGTNETDKDCADIIYNILETNMAIPNARDIKIVRCHRVGAPPAGRRTGDSRPRSIIIKLHWYGDRQRIWAARKNLKNSDIFINEDFPAEIRQRRKKLFPILRKARNELNMKKSFLSVDKLHLIDADDKRTVYDVNSLHKLPPALDARFITTVKKENHLAFFGELCPLSNFHPAPIVHHGKKFACVEQMYQHMKAMSADDLYSAKKIMETEIPLECKIIGDKVKPSANWDKEKEGVMRQALYLKFSQNVQLKDFLLQTGTMQLAEASPNDLYWGTGVGLGKVGSTKVAQWRGENKLGNLLCEIRESFI